MDNHEYQPARTPKERITHALRQVVLLRETGPKSAAWQRARQQTIWHLHALLDAYQQQDDSSQTPPPPPPQ